MRAATALLILIFLLSSPVFAHYGARFEPPDGAIYHGSGWDYNSSQSLYEGMFPAGHAPLILQTNNSIPGSRGTSVARVVAALTHPVVHSDSQYVEFSLHW